MPSSWHGIKLNYSYGKTEEKIRKIPVACKVPSILGKNEQPILVH